MRSPLSEVISKCRSVTAVTTAAPFRLRWRTRRPPPPPLTHAHARPAPAFAQRPALATATTRRRVLTLAERRAARKRPSRFILHRRRESGRSARGTAAATRALAASSAAAPPAPSARSRRWSRPGTRRPRSAETHPIRPRPDSTLEEYWRSTPSRVAVASRGRSALRARRRVQKRRTGSSSWRSRGSTCSLG